MLPTLTGDTPFCSLSDCVRAHAQSRPHDEALVDAQERLSWSALDARMDAVAARLQAQGLRPGDAIAVCALASAAYATVFLGALRAGVVVAPLSPTLDAHTWARMVMDAPARQLFIDAEGDRLRRALAEHHPQHALLQLPCTRLDGPDLPWCGAPAALPADTPGARPQPWVATPEAPFNIIYSSGTTGTPKGIVQSHGMRWTHIRRGLTYGYGPHSRTLLSTPLYSNTTLVAFMPTLGLGGCVHLMPKFDAQQWLQWAEREGITHTMLVPVQYQRLLDHPDFDRTDLSRFAMKFCTSAPFSAELKRAVLQRWPGGLVEFYGMTEGGGTCILEAHRHPEKLHTVGQPAPGHDIRLIDEAGVEIDRHAQPEALGEVVGHSPGMMSGYHGLPEKTREAEWYDPQGRRFIRTGDVGRFDADGFLVLMDRRKDMVISGGFNVYPSDLEALLRQHPGVADAAVVGVPSRRWGETPVAWVVPRPDSGVVAESLLAWFNARCGKLQRLADLAFVDALPRSSIGKVLKRELRELWSRPVP